MAVNCVRNTVIEDDHAGGKLDDAEMKAFNQEVANKSDRFLQFLFPTITIGSTLIRSCQSIASVLYPRSRIERYSSSCSKRWTHASEHFNAAKLRNRERSASTTNTR